jgi:hypothetical protein
VDDQRFDQLARLLGSGLSRKRFLRLLTGATVSGVAVIATERPAPAKRHKSGGRGPKPEGGDTCGGDCTTDDDCDDTADCVCDTSSGSCAILTCGGTCDDDEDCRTQDLPFCSCVHPVSRGQAGTEGEIGQCGTEACIGECSKDSDCGLTSGCICDTTTFQCVTVGCGGPCKKDSDCPELTGCTCVIPEGETIGFCETQTCPGDCASNEDCAGGEDACVCFLGPGVDVAAAPAGPRGPQAAGVTGPTGPTGACGECLGNGEPCDATTECCGQLVCEPNSQSPALGFCEQKRPPKPKPHHNHCQKHGQSCHRDNDCCAQGTCYRGKCGEKDTHCHHDNECAQGYHCVGGNLSAGHRRCRRNGHHKKHRRD